MAASFEIAPEVLAEAPEKDICESIRSGGLFNVKARRIREVSWAVLELFDGDLEGVLALPLEEAKEKLKELPGIGDKTADVLLTDVHSCKYPITG